MKLIESKVELLEQEPGLEGIYKQIELAGRTCYKSEDKITDASSVEFVKKMIKNGHTAMLEHGTVYLRIPNLGVADAPGDCLRSWYRYKHNKYSKCVEIPPHDVYELCVTTNLRVLYENDGLTDLQYLVKPTESFERRITLKFTTDRGVSHELVRHRVFSFAQESTRYCNYGKDKFGNELTFIRPSGIEKNTTFNQHGGVERFLQQCENLYIGLIDSNWTAQDARAILPNCLKTEIVMTGFVSDWKHFFDLRLLGTTGKPHPDMLELCEKARKVLEEHDLWRLIYKPN